MAMTVYRGSTERRVIPLFFFGDTVVSPYSPASLLLGCNGDIQRDVRLGKLVLTTVDAIN